MEKILFFDTETTGLNAEKHGMTQAGLILLVDGIVKEEHDIHMRPFPGDIIEDRALEIQGKTLDEIMAYQAPEQAYAQMLKIFDAHINKMDKLDKFYPAGFNVGFDTDFMGQFFRKNGSKYGFGSYCNWKRLDALPLLYYLDAIGKISLLNYKLETVCEYFGIKIDAHDAMSDIRATREVLNKVHRILNSLNK